MHESTLIIYIFIMSAVQPPYYDLPFSQKLMSDAQTSTSEFATISVICVVFCSGISMGIIYSLYKAIKESKTNLQKLSVPLKKYAIGFSCMMLAYLVLQFIDMVLNIRGVFAGPEIEILMDFCLIAMLTIWLKQWREMISVYIKKKFTRVRLPQTAKDDLARRNLQQRIQNLGGKSPYSS